MKNELVKIADFLGYHLRLRNHYSIINKDALIKQISLPQQLESDLFYFFLSHSPIKPKNKLNWHLILQFLASNTTYPEIGVYKHLISEFDQAIIDLLRNLTIKSISPIPSWELTLKEINNPKLWIDLCPSSIPKNDPYLVPYFPNFKAIDVIPFYIPMNWLSSFPHATLITLYINHIITNAPTPNIPLIELKLTNNQYYYIPPNFRDVLKERFNDCKYPKLFERIISFFP